MNGCRRPGYITTELVFQKARPAGFEPATRCLEVQGDATGMVPDVGFIGLLTRCRSGLTRMVATRGGYRPGCARSWPVGQFDPIFRGPFTEVLDVFGPGAVVAVEASPRSAIMTSLEANQKATFC
jgi:hypothetical protein